MAFSVISPLKPKPDRGVPFVGPDGKPTEAFNTFLQTAEKLLKLLNGAGGMVLANAANDAAAATAGVPVGALYRNGSVVMIRVA